MVELVSVLIPQTKRAYHVSSIPTGANWILSVFAVEYREKPYCMGFFLRIHHSCTMLKQWWKPYVFFVCSGIGSETRELFRPAREAFAIICSLATKANRPEMTIWLPICGFPYLVATQKVQVDNQFKRWMCCCHVVRGVTTSKVDLSSGRPAMPKWHRSLQVGRCRAWRRACATRACSTRLGHRGRVERGRFVWAGLIRLRF